MTKSFNITEDHINLLHSLEKDGNLSQRQIAVSAGLSIGKVNYIIKTLVDIGFIKFNNFKSSKKKSEYAYILTPKGIKEKATITKRFIIKKQQEYDKLLSYIHE